MPRGVVRSRSSYTKPSFGRPLKFQIPLDCATYEKSIEVSGQRRHHYHHCCHIFQYTRYSGGSKRKGASKQLWTSNLNNSKRPEGRAARWRRLLASGTCCCWIPRSAEKLGFDRATEAEMKRDSLSIENKLHCKILRYYWWRFYSL